MPWSKHYEPTRQVRINAAGLSDRGRRRQRNEDRWVALLDHQLFVVADGMGGEHAGDLASEIVVDFLAGRLPKLLAVAGDVISEGLAGLVATALTELSRRLCAECSGRAGLQGMGSTVVLAAIREHRALIAHLGDSRAYLFRDRHLQRLTNDHTLGQRMFELGDISEEQRASHPASHRLTRFVGMSGPALADTLVVDLQPRDRLLLCTDGLHGQLDDRHLSEILDSEGDPSETCRRLIDAANEAGGIDNITALTIVS